MPSSLWSLSESAALLWCSPPPACPKGTPICSDVSQYHVDLSFNSALNAIASLTLSIVTIVSLLCLMSNLPVYLGSTLVKIISLSGCSGFRCFSWCPPQLQVTCFALAPSTSLLCMKVFSKYFMTSLCAQCLQHVRSVSFCHHLALSNSSWLVLSTLRNHPGKKRMGLLFKFCRRAASLKDAA